MHQSIISALLAIVIASARLALAAEIIDPGQGAVELPRAGSGATGLSGITYIGGDRFLAVSDRGGRLFALEIRFDPLTGAIVAASIKHQARLASAHDTEGIASAGPESVWIADEIGPAVREHRIDDGSVVSRLAIPQVFRNLRRNMSLESVTVDPEGRIWIANEEALRGDGPGSSAKSGTLVRIQRFDRSVSRSEKSRSEKPERGQWIPTVQWAYRTDPIPGEPLGSYALSGVVDLAALPDGTLLALERGLGSGGIRCRIYEIDGSQATDTSIHPRLDGLAITPVQKRLLWEGSALGDNFEGMALGPALAAGERSLVLISDDGGVTQPRLYPLRIRLEAKPSSVVPPAASASDKTGFLQIAAFVVAAMLVGLLGAWWHRGRAAYRRNPH